MSFRINIVVPLCGLVLGCQLDAPVEPAPQSAAVAPIVVDSDSCGPFARHELSVPAVPGRYAIDGSKPHSIAIDIDGDALTWRSTLGIDAVIVTGAGSANAYVYRGESTGDRALSAPSAHDGTKALELVRFCYDWELAVDVTASSSYAHRTLWSIDQKPARHRVTLARGQSVDVPYAVEASVASEDDGPMSVFGTVSIVNPSPMASQVTGFEARAGDTPVELDCKRVLPFELGASETLTCRYTAILARPGDGDVRVSVLTAGAVESGNGAAPYSRETSRVERTGECTDVHGHRGQTLGTACAGDAPARFGYSVRVGPAECGQSTIKSLDLDVFVDCRGGCTRSARYWGAQIEGPAGSYSSLSSQLRVAHQNIEAGASPTDVQPAVEAATALLSTYGAGDAETPVVGEQFRRVAKQLRDFNTGKIGPGPCAE